MHIIDYKIVHSLEGYLKLESLVRQNLNEGWQPIGGVTYGKMLPLFEGDVENLVWIQALVKYETY